MFRMKFPLILVVLVGIAHAMTPAQVKKFPQENDDFMVTVAQPQEPSLRNISQNCKAALEHITKLEAFEYLDNTGKPASGFLNGDSLWTGDFAGCLKMPSSHYCLTSTSISINSGQPGLTQLSITWGVCVPENCTERDVADGLEAIVSKINFLAHNVLKENISFHVISLGTQREAACYKESEYSTGVILTLSLIAVIILLCGLGTIIDMIDSLFATSGSLQPQTGMLNRNEFSPQEDLSGDHAVLLTRNNVLATSVQIRDPDSNGLCKRILLAFSLIKNTDAVMNTKVAANSITCINGIRVISMSWVILGHSFLFFLMSGVTDNPLDALGHLHSFSFMAVSNALFSVDSFFFLSGLLVGYLGWRRMEKNNGKIPLFGFYFHRFWRLTPVYMFAILFYDKLNGFLGKGPIWFTQQSNPPCDKYWWTNLLYINNFYPAELGKECMGWSWYLANDMQFYAISPIILYTVYRWKWIGAVLSIGGLTVVSIIVTGAIMLYYNFSALAITQLIGGNPFENHYQDYVYVKPYCRITPYLVGLFLGYLLHRNASVFSWLEKTRCQQAKLINWIINVCGWLVAAGFALAVLYGPYKEFKTDPELLTKTENVIYGALSRCVWGIALAWVVYACHNGFGGQINRFLSAAYWMPLSRLTYGAYLLHPIVLYTLYNSFETPGHVTIKIVTFYFIGATALSYGAAFLMAIFIELPLSNLEKFVFKM